MITAAWTGRADAEEAGAALAAWTGPRWTGQLQQGDIGWHLRFDEEELDRLLLVVRDDGRPVAVALADTLGEVRVAVEPARYDDERLAASLVDLLLAAPRAAPTSIDGSQLAAWRHRLAELGWSAAGPAMVALHRSLRDVDPRLPEGVRPVTTEAEAADRVLVQRRAFEGSTFTLARWRLMAATSLYEGSLDLLARDGEGRPVAAGTAWWPGPGRTGQLEPVGTDRDHQGLGHGRRLVQGLCSALAAAGAPSAAVETPADNAAAVRAYRAAGFRSVGVLMPMRPQPGAD